MRVLVIIPARSGSKGIPHKNVMDVGGRPLISWSIIQAKNAQVDKIIVSTDSEEYKRKIDSWFPGMDLVPFIRPEKLARATTPTADVILDVLERYKEYGIFVLLEPTAPLRFTRDIQIPVSYLKDEKAKAVVSVCDNHRCHPAHCYMLDRRKFIQPNADLPHLRRQDLTPMYHLTGTVYAAFSDWYKVHKTFITRETLGYKVENWQDKEIDEPDDIISILPFLSRVK